ncbi:hypothetical protein HZS_4989 [Henneguya salminicola]|nr:hypothetical protein HZS_4989 [Henneguya salminicola]
MDDIFSQTAGFHSTKKILTRRRKSYTALFKLKVIEYASPGNMKRASYTEVCGWISETWHRRRMSASKTDFEKHSTRQGKKKPAMRKMREGDGGDESVETDVPEMLVDIIESFEIHSDDDFEGFK